MFDNIWARLQNPGDRIIKKEYNGNAPFEKSNWVT